METNATNSELFEKLVKRYVPKRFEEAKVLSVDEEKFTCEAENLQGGKIPGIRLNAITGSLPSFQAVIPKLKSRIVVAFIDANGQQSVLFQCSEIEKVLITANTEIIFNKGENGGIPLIDPLYSRITDLESKMNSLIGKFNSHTHVTTATVAASAAVGVLSPTPATETPISPTTTKEDLSNQNISQ